MVMYTTIVDVENEIRAEFAFDNDTIPSSQAVTEWIGQASSEVDLRTDNMYSSTLSSSVYLDSDGSGVLLLPTNPIISISELRYNKSPMGVTPEWVTLVNGDTFDYYYYSDTGAIHFINGDDSTNNLIPGRGSRKFCVTYTSGYKTVPSYIKRLVTLMVAKRVILSLVSSQANVEGGSIQVGTIKVSDPSNFSLSTIKGIDAEVKDLFSNLGLDFKVFKISKVY